MLYWLNPANLTDRQISRSRDEVHYADLLIALIRNRATAENLSGVYIPLAQVMRMHRD